MSGMDGDRDVRRIAVAVMCLALCAAPANAWAQVWGLRQRITMPVPEHDAQFGSRAAIAGDVLALGAPYLTGGRVYVYRRVRCRWLLEATLSSPAGEDDGWFGSELEVDGDTLAVAAPGESGRAGTLYVYERSGTTWSLTATLTTASPAPGEQLGSVLEMDDGRIAARTCTGGSASVHVFERDGAGLWAEQQVLVASDATSRSGCGWGNLLSLDGARLASLEPRQVHVGNSGAVFVFELTAGAWVETARIDINVGSLGPAVALMGDRLAVGTPNNSTAGGPPVRLFDHATSGWTERSSIDAPDGDRGHGRALAFLDGRLAVCSDRSFPPPFSDPCRIYRDDPTGDVLELVLPTPPVASHTFSQTIDADGTTLLVPAWGDTVGGLELAGAAYVFVLADPNGTACADPDACISGFCVDSVCCDTECGNGADDCSVCSAALGASADGVCSPRPITDPQLCRPAAGSCDVEESCDGASLDCPPDAFVDAGTACRDAAGSCDLAEFCTGASPSCPADERAGDDVVCRPAADPCDLEETCTGTSNECPIDLRGECPPDAGSIADGGPTVDASDEGGMARAGCSCRTVPTESGTVPMALMLFGLVLVAARRR